MSAPGEAGAAGEMRIDVKDLRVDATATGIPIVDEVSFSVPIGQTMGLVGESGSGKTTAALALLGYARSGLSLAGGEVLIDGLDVLALPASKLRHLRGKTVAYVPQDPGTALNPALKIGSQLSELASAHGVDSSAGSERIDAVLDEVGLGELGVRDRYPHQLSGGQQQRVALAMAFVLRPSVIVLDEPTTGLDVSTQRRVVDTISAMCASHGVAGVFVSHDLAVVGSLVDQVTVMYAGRVAEQGPTAEIFQRPRHPYTKALLRAVPSLDGASVLVGLRGQPPAPDARPSGCRFAPRCEFAEEQCTSQEIPLAPTDEGRRLVRCIRIDEIPRESPARKSAAIPGLVQAESSAFLQVTDLNASYGGKRVLEGVSLSLDSGECLAVVGESGSGKTTLARCIVGLHTEFEGAVELDGRLLGPTAGGRTRDDRRALQYVFQNPYASLNPRKSVRSILEQPIRHFFDCDAGEIRAKISAALDSASLTDRFLDLYPRELSGGERQRVAIARALVAEPRALVCDEITSALDVSVQAAVIETLKGLQVERDLALIFVTHNLALVRNMAQRVMVVRNGRVVEAGVCGSVLDRPQDTYTQALVKDLPQPQFLSPMLGAG